MPAVVYTVPASVQSANPGPESIRQIRVSLTVFSSYLKSMSGTGEVGARDYKLMAANFPGSRYDGA